MEDPWGRRRAQPSPSSRARRHPARPRSAVWRPRAPLEEATDGEGRDRHHRRGREGSAVDPGWHRLLAQPWNHAMTASLRFPRRGSAPWGPPPPTREGERKRGRERLSSKGRRRVRARRAAAAQAPGSRHCGVAHGEGKRGGGARSRESGMREGGGWGCGLRLGFTSEVPLIYEPSRKAEMGFFWAKSLGLIF